MVLEFKVINIFQANQFFYIIFLFFKYKQLTEIGYLNVYALTNLK